VESNLRKRIVSPDELHVVDDMDDDVHARFVRNGSCRSHPTTFQSARRQDVSDFHSEKSGMRIFSRVEKYFLNRSRFLLRFNKFDMSASCCLDINPIVNFNLWGRQNETD
jgi:hypothetical protein